MRKETISRPCSNQELTHTAADVANQIWKPCGNSWTIICSCRSAATANPATIPERKEKLRSSSALSSCPQQTLSYSIWISDILDSFTRILCLSQACLVTIGWWMNPQLRLNTKFDCLWEQQMYIRLVHCKAFTDKMGSGLPSHNAFLSHIVSTGSWCSTKLAFLGNFATMQVFASYIRNIGLGFIIICHQREASRLTSW